MRTNIVIDNSLMQRAMKATGFSTKKAVVEEGLRLLIKVKGQEGIHGQHKGVRPLNLTYRKSLIHECVTGQRRITGNDTSNLMLT